jgi:hypothetical protein
VTRWAASPDFGAAYQSYWLTITGTTSGGAHIAVDAFDVTP